MADSGIIFSAPMVRALIDGSKTQTRRVLKPQPIWDGSLWHVMKDGFDGGAHGIYETEAEMLHDACIWWKWRAGDRLWVREGWTVDDDGKPAYRADRVVPPLVGGPATCRGEGGPRLARWRPSIHMPRWASRLTLTVTDVRVQRLQEISEADAVAEGVIWQEPTDEDRAWAKRFAEENCTDEHIDGVWIAPGARQGYGMTKEDRDRPQWGPTAAFAFRCLWNSLHGPEAWDANPWVTAISFTVHRRNIDRMETTP